jgi:hypothetical protein
MAALASCEIPATAIVIRVDTDLTPVSAMGPLQSIDVRASFSSERVLYERNQNLGDPSVVVPGEVVLRAANADEQRPIQVDVVGRLVGGGSITRRFVVRFTPRQITLMDAFLAARCTSEPTCLADQTCGRGGTCESVNQNALPPYQSTPPAMRADVPMTDHPMDSPSEPQIDVTIDVSGDSGRPDDLPRDASAVDVARCPVGTPLSCHDRCVDPSNDGSHCGGCDLPCTAPEHGTASCRSGSCVRTCDSGYAFRTGRCELLVAPRLISPLSGSFVRSRRPTLRFRNPPGTDATRVEICATRDCGMVEQSIETAGDRVSVSAGLSPGVHFWRALGRAGGGTSPASSVWSFYVSAGSSSFDTSHGSISDYDGDGYPDLTVSSARTSPDGGAVHVYPGRRSGISRTPGVTLASPVGVLSGYGSRVAGVGDLNGDGYSDLAVGAPIANSEGGQVHIYFGSSTGLSATSRLVLDAPSGTSLRFGASVHYAGDIDADGYADLLVGTAAASGRAFLFRGSADGPSSMPTLTLMNPESTGSFGLVIAGAFDANGDDRPDVAIALPYFTARSSLLYVYLGRPTGLAATPDLVLTLPSENSYHLSTGDFNGDGFDDLLVGTPGTGVSPSGALLFYGSVRGPSLTPSFGYSAPDYMYAGFGTVMGLGDTNADGFDDLAIGNGSVGTWVGRTYIYLGGPGGPSRTASSSIAGMDGDRTYFGGRIAGPGDTDGDGYADMAVGASGKVFLFFGSATGIVTSPGRILENPAGTGDGFPECIALRSRPFPSQHLAFVPIGVSDRSPYRLMTQRAWGGEAAGRRPQNRLNS